MKHAKNENAKKTVGDRFLTWAEAREIDVLAIEKYGIPGIVLMENAARGVVDCLEREGIDGPVTICCGKGNNGGDGFAIARHLAVRGKEPTIWVFGEPDALIGDAAVNYRIVKKMGIPIRLFFSQSLCESWELFEADLSGSNWVIDALLGTGSQGPPRFPTAEAISAINQRRERSGFKVLAVDMPSGLEAESGIPNKPTVRADLTCTFVAPKIEFLAAEAKEFLGTVYVLDIGFDPDKVSSK